MMQAAMQVHETSAIEAITQAHSLHLQTSKRWAGQIPNMRDLCQAISLFKSFSDAGHDQPYAIRAAYEEVILLPAKYRFARVYASSLR